MEICFGAPLNIAHGLCYYPFVQPIPLPRADHLLGVGAGLPRLGVFCY